MIFYSKHARDLRRRGNPGGTTYITQWIRARRRSMMRQHGDPDFAALAGFSAKCHHVCWSKDCRIVDSVNVDSGKSNAASHPRL